jgi:hypothetical protein
MLLQCRLQSLQTLPLAISTTLLRWPTMIPKDPLEHGDHPVFGWQKSSIKCNDLSSIYGDPLELSELLLQNLKEVCDCPSRGRVSPVNLVLGHMLIQIPGVNWLDERGIVVEVVPMVTAPIRLWPLVKQGVRKFSG